MWVKFTWSTQNRCTHIPCKKMHIAVHSYKLVHRVKVA